LQEPAISFYPQPDESSPLPLILLLVSLVLCYHLRLDLSAAATLLTFSHQSPVWLFILSHACFVDHSFYHPWFHRPHNVWRGRQISNLDIM